MGDNVRRLTLIDAEKYNSLMRLLEQATKRQKMLDDSKQTQAEAELVDSHADMLNSVKNKSSLGGSDIVNYMRKKDKYQAEVAARALPQQQETDPHPQPNARQLPR
ncbi:Hypothetical predicted protein [Paramuricea clavata]|uniref:Uncharacterized protein n=1 Tax=Paramuricea clavata TaxID=317549 RepID=A0A6S7GT95_PARCT|nr:Hypothetical predicted protein [Paramuricea clavata]